LIFAFRYGLLEQEGEKKHGREAQAALFKERGWLRDHILLLVIKAKIPQGPPTHPDSCE